MKFLYKTKLSLKKTQRLIKKGNEQNIFLKIRKKMSSQLKIKWKHPPWFAPEKQILLLNIPKTYWMCVCSSNSHELIFQSSNLQDSSTHPGVLIFTCNIYLLSPPRNRSRFTLQTSQELLGLKNLLQMWRNINLNL